MKKTRILAAVLAGLMVVTMLAGCGGTSSVNGVELNQEVKNLEGYLASAEPLDLTFHFHQSNGVIMWKNDGPITKAAAEATNINLINQASAGQADSAQAFNTMLMGDVLPDVIHSTGANLDQAGMDGAMIPLEDLIEEYAPNIHKYFSEHPEYIAMSKAYDGHLYYIPAISLDGPTEGWILRKDWMEKLGLETPTNVEEFYNVLKAFREQDPNGNGLKDEIPFLDRTKSPWDLLALFGVSRQPYEVTEDGKVVANFMKEEYKNAMRELAKWYAEGLIDPEIFTRNNAREELYANNNGGATVDWFSSTYSYNETLSKEALGDSYFGFELVTIDPPKDVNGVSKSYTPRTVLQSQGWGISKDNKHVAETLKFFDFWFTDEGRTLLWFGPDRKTTADGKPDYSDEARAYVGGPTEYMSSIGGALNIGSIRMLEAEVGAMPQEAKDAYMHYRENVEHIKPGISYKYTPEETRINKSKGTDTSTYMDEMRQNWLLGNKDVDATWDEYITHLKELGVDEVIAMQQAAYDRMFK
ncbi:MAG: extracellular solute-binding protein [Ruminococcaceae bacterium]|nr:extracellular solute-binding protein [Oscillospiraceae bacterium]